MPIYEYACNSCGERFEVVQRFSDPPVESCRVCDGAVRKVIAPTAFVLKGSGWYKTDYASPAKSTASDSEKQFPSEKNATKETQSSVEKKESRMSSEK